MGEKVFAAGQGQLDGLQKIDVVVHGAGPVVARHGVFEAPHGSVVRHGVLVDEVPEAAPAAFQHHARHGALVKVQEKGRSLA